MDIEWISNGASCIDKRGKVYSIITTAKDVQTSEMMVVYSQTFGEMMTLCCPLDAFSISFSPAKSEEKTAENITNNKPKNGHERMMEFLDTDDFEKKSKLLRELHALGELNDAIIDNLAATLDVVIEDGDLYERYDQLRICVETRARYETVRLR